MEIRIDGAAAQLDLSGCANLLDVTELVEASAAARNRIVTVIVVNGFPLNDIQNETLAGFALADLEHVEYTTGNPRRVAIQVLYEIGRTIPNLSGELQRIGRMIQSQDEPGAMARFQQCLDQWVELQEGIRGSTAALGIELDEVPLGAGTAADAFEELVEQLSETTEAMEAGDLLGLSDALEYEFPAVLEQVQSAVYEIINLAERRLH